MDEAAKIAEWLRIFIEPGQLTELRALDVSDGRGSQWTHHESGFFDYEHLDDMAKRAWELSVRHNATGVYFVPNMINTGLLARSANRTQRAKKEPRWTKDSDIIARKWLLIDVDPVRPDMVSSSNEEKAIAWKTQKEVSGWIAEHLFHDVKPVLCDSGNGYHLMYHIDNPNMETSLVKIILNMVADEFDSDQVKIDRKVFNPARIVKLYGTISRKGDSIPDRPHRKSEVIDRGGH